MYEGWGNYVKGGGTEKRGGETKNLKREGKLGQRVGALKRGGWNPLPNYSTFLNISFEAQLIKSPNLAN